VSVDDMSAGGPVLGTGAGGAAGVAVIQALHGRRGVAAADCDPDAVGLALTGAAGVLPRPTTRTSPRSWSSSRPGTGRPHWSARSLRR
jgi:hypothetical protein